MLKAGKVVSGLGIIFAIVLSIIGLTAQPTAASMIKALELPEMVEKAVHIIKAKTLRQESRWDLRGRIVTDVTLVVEEAIKGKYRAGDKVVVTKLGGIIGEIGMRVAGSPEFYNNKLAIVFLREVPSLGELRVLGMSQGVIHLDPDVRSEIDQSEREVLVVPSEDNTILVQHESDGALKSVLSTDTPLFESYMLSEIRRLMSFSTSK